MKKSLCVLMGGLALISLVSCKEKPNEAISQMVSGKSSDEVLDMLVEKHSDKTFLDSYTSQNIKIKFNASAKDTTDKIKYSGDLVIDPKKGVRSDGKFSLTRSKARVSIGVDFEYEMNTDRFYLSYDLGETKLNECTENFSKNDSEEETQRENPTIEDIALLIDEYRDSISYKVGSSALELTFKSDKTLNSEIEELAKSFYIYGSEMYSKNTSFNVTMKFDENLMFKGIHCSIGTTLGNSREFHIIGVSLKLDVSYGDFKYVELEDKDTYIISEE